MRHLLVGLFLLGCQGIPKETPPPPAQTAAPVVSSVPTPVVRASPEKPPERLLAQFATQFATGLKFENRAANIQLLATKLTKFVLKPGEAWSFNEAVGPRTLERGFKEAPTYYLGEIQPGVGGGTCQVSSTLYAAALHTNIEVLERRPHSRASSYIGPGLDATVSYPKPCWDTEKPDLAICYDLRLKNPYSFDLTLRVKTEAETDGKRALVVSVFGTGEAPKVITKWIVYGSEPFSTRFRTVPYWHNDHKRQKQVGRSGLTGVRLLTITHPDGRVETKRVLSKYNPVPEVFEVGTEFEEPVPESNKENSYEVSAPQ